MATIPAVCQCGKRFQANESLAGKRVKCPTCGAAINVPAAPNAADPFGLSGSQPPLGIDTQAMLSAGMPTPTSYPNSSGYVPQPNYGQQYPPPPKKNNTALIVGIIAGVAGIGLVMVIGVALLLPAIQAARNAARRQAAQGNNAPGAPGANNPLTPNAGVGNTSNWRPYTSPAGRYSVLMPPNVQTRTQMEGLVTAYMAIADAGGNRGAYFVAYNDLPMTPNAIPVDEVLDGACNGAMTRVNGRETSRETTTFAGQPCRALSFEGNQAGQQFRARTKVFLAGRRLYQVMWVGAANNEPSEDLQKFFDSFQLTSVVDTPTRSPLGGAPAQPSSAAPPDEAKRKRVYNDVLSSRRLTESLTQQRDRMAAQGLPTPAMDQQLENLKNTEATRMQAICTRHRITQEQLDQIIAEGDSNNWGNR